MIMMTFDTSDLELGLWDLGYSLKMSGRARPRQDLSLGGFTALGFFVNSLGEVGLGFGSICRRRLLPCLST